MTDTPEDDGFITCFPATATAATDLWGTPGCLGAAISAAQATKDLLIALAGDGVHPADNVGSGETLACLAEAIRLTHAEMLGTDSDDDQLAGAARRYLEDRA